MNEEKKTDQEFARPRPPEPPDKGGGFLRGCGIALGIAAFVFLFVVGACFVMMS